MPKITYTLKEIESLAKDFHNELGEHPCEDSVEGFLDYLGFMEAMEEEHVLDAQDPINYRGLVLC